MAARLTSQAGRLAQVATTLAVAFTAALALVQVNG